jgi:hypothetical protein
MSDIFHAVLCVAEVYCSREYMKPRTPIATFNMLAPPPQYDVPYKGALSIWVSSQATIDTMCKTRDGKYTSHTACAIHYNDNWCGVWILKDIVEGKRFDTIDVNGDVAHGVKGNLALTLRHELAHCNGWPGDHPDGKRIDVGISTDMPKLPASTHWLPAYPSEVCVTLDGKVDDCKKAND